MNLKTILTLVVVCAASSAAVAQTYSGTLSCGQSLIAPERPGFDSPAVLTVKNGTAQMKRSSDKFEESLEGRVAGQKLSLEGQGRMFAGGQPWTTKLQGSIDGKTFKGKGELLINNGERYRECQVSLVNTAKPIEQVSQAPATVPVAQKPVADSPVIASFDCQKATSKTEKMICSNPQTAKLDVALSNAYRKALAASDNVNDLKSEQMAWLSSVRNKCESSECLDREYAARIKALEVAGTTSSTNAPAVVPTPPEPQATIAAPTIEEPKQTAQEAVVVAPKVEVPVAEAMPAQKPAPVGMSSETKKDLALYAIIAIAVLLTGLIVGYSIYWFRTKYPLMRAKELANRKASKVPTVTTKTNAPTNNPIGAALKSENRTVAASVPAQVYAATNVSSEPTATYDVKISGYKPGEDPQVVRQRLEALLKATPAQVQQLLSVPEYVLKKGLTREQAQAYQTAILNTGANCLVQEESKELPLEVDLPPAVQIAAQNAPLHTKPIEEVQKKPTAEQSIPEKARATSSPNELPEWFYENDGQRIGPISESGVSALIKSKQLDEKSSMWKQGFSAWQPLGSTALAEHLDRSAPPPLLGNQVNNSIVWILAFAPVIGEILQGFIAGMVYKNQYLVMEALSSGKFFYVTVILNVVLALMDERKLQNAGYDTKKYKIWAWLLVPVYLFQRAKSLQQNLAYFIVWMVCFFVMLLL